jgi:IS30 family transposase
MQITPLKHYKQIQPEERVTLASLHFQNFTVRDIARTLGRGPSTITRELNRNSIGGHYASKPAVVCVAERRIKARSAPKLHQESVLFGIVHHLLCIRCSPEQISMALSATYPKGHEHRVSHETIYNCIYAQPVGELKRDLIKVLGQAHNKRVPRRKGQDRRVQIPDMVSIHVRPPEIEDRQFPGHWEGDLIKGEANGSAVGTLVERTSRLLMLVKLPQVKAASALNVLQGFTDKLLSVALPLRLSMTYDPSSGDGDAQRSEQTHGYRGVLL